MKEEALDRTVWRAGFGRGFGPVVRQTANGMNECDNADVALFFKGNRTGYRLSSATCRTSIAIKAPGTSKHILYCFSTPRTTVTRAEVPACLDKRSP